jgi:hypothetical protein
MFSSVSTAYILAAVIGFAAVAIGPVISARLIARRITKATEMAAKAAVDAKDAAARAEVGLLKAQTDAADAARALIETARGTDSKLEEIKRVADGTHQIVNNQHTILLRNLANMAQIIATQNPKDMAARQTAEATEKEASKAEDAQAALTGTTADEKAKEAIDPA